MPRAIRLALVAAVGFGLAAGTTEAQGPPSDRLAPGFYVGGDLGGTSYDNACDPAALSCDHTDSTSALFAGYRFDSRFGLEIGALHLGEAHAVYPRLTSTVEVVGDVDGYDLAGLLRFPIGSGDWEAYLRGGAFHWDSDDEDVFRIGHSSGKITGIGPGTAAVDVEYHGREDSAIVTVLP